MSLLGHEDGGVNGDGRLVGDRLVTYVAEHARIILDVRLVHNDILRVARGKHSTADHVDFHGWRRFR